MLAVLERIYVFVARRVARLPEWILKLAMHKAVINEGARLDLRAQWLLWVANLGFQPRLHELEPVQARKAQAQMLKILDDPGPALPRVEDHHLVGRTGYEFRVRVYWPQVIDQTKPAILYLHGGGFVVCDVDTHDPVCRRLCRDTQSIVVSVDYRLAPEHPFPAAVEDSLDAYAWLLERAQEFGVDKSCILIVGDSAGGSLATATCLAIRDENKLLQPLAQVLIYPALDARSPARLMPPLARGFGLDLETIDWFIRHYVTPKDLLDYRAAPALAPSYRGLCPALIYTAGFDPLGQEGAVYAQRLRRDGIPVKYHCYESLVHGFVSMPFVKNARIAIDEISKDLVTVFEYGAETLCTLDDTLSISSTQLDAAE